MPSCKKANTCEDSVFGRRSNLERPVRVLATGTLGNHDTMPIHTAGVCVMSCSVAISSSAYRHSGVLTSNILVRVMASGPFSPLRRIAIKVGF
ncbi:hypothetical protein [Desulfosporosinus sp. OT]|uniref:hypothetical protein n=1 Tax=Desulfosporosinus sp. OT TaxID=913865 RepID=UPI001300C442|nr:hypothetical protein [Desulfosporosinus sp. OT]